MINENPERTWFVNHGWGPVAGPTDNVDVLLKDIVRTMNLRKIEGMRGCTLRRVRHNPELISSTRYRTAFHDLVKWQQEGPVVDTSKIRYKIWSRQRSVFNGTRPLGVPRRKCFIEYTHDQMVKIVKRRTNLKFHVEKID